MTFEERERRAFQRAIDADPLDPTPRWVFADWLNEHGYDDEAAEQRSWTRERLESRQWMVNFAAAIAQGHWWDEEEDGPPPHKWMDYDTLLGAADAYLRSGESYCLPFDTPDVIWDHREEFWRHYRIVTGADVRDGMNDTFFRCAC